MWKFSLIFLLCVSAAFGQTKLREGTQTMGALPTAQGGAPAGGSTGEVLTKSSNSDYAYSWSVIPSAPVTSVFGRTGAVTAQSGDYSAFYQPLDSDLTAIAALSTLAFGRGSLEMNDAASFRSYIGAGASNFSGLYNDLTFTGSNITSIETRSYNDLQDLPVFSVSNHIITGGGVAWTGTGFDFIVSPCTYVISGVQYDSVTTPITLSPADLSFDRIDVFVVDDAGVATVVEGTPGGPPLEPQIDPASQLRLQAVIVPAGASVPDITNEDLYLENTEWTSATNAGTINLASTNNPYAGTKDIEGTSVATGNNFTLTKPSGTLSLADYTSVNLQIRSKATWPNNKGITFTWFNGATAVGTSVTLKNGSFGFNSSNTTTYQQIVIASSLFNTGSAAVNKLQAQIGGGGSNIGWYIDNIQLQAGGGGGGGNGGDFSTNTVTSVANEIVLFADTTGKLGKRSTGTGIVKLTSGVQGLASAGVDYQAAGNYITALTGDGTAAGPGSSAFTLATVNSNVGTFTNASVTVNGKGLVTAASSGTDPASLISDTAYNATSWDGVTTIAPSKNAVRDKFESLTDPASLISDTAYDATSWDGVTTIAPSKNAVRDKFESLPASAPTTTDYLVGTTDAGLSNEIVVGTTPGGELGGTWGSPTLDDSVTVATWTMTGVPGLTVNNGATSAGSIGFKEDSDNGSNTATLIGPASTGDVTITLPAATDTLVGKATTDTLTNKRITKRSSAVSNTTTLSIDTDTYDYVEDTGLTGAVAVDTTGTPTTGQTLWVSLTGTAARAITWEGTDFEASTVALPTTTVTTNRLDVGFVWNPATTKWRCVASQ